MLFTKCASLCNDLEILMKNDFALTIVYTIATLGTIKIALIPIKEENIKILNPLFLGYMCWLIIEMIEAH